MESLAPPLQFIYDLRYELLRGQSLRTSLHQSLSRRHQVFYLALRNWFMAVERGDAAYTCPELEKSPYRQALMELLRRGLAGHPIMEALAAIEVELIQACKEEIDQHIQLLPTKAMLPVLLFQFPAYVLLLLGPIVQELIAKLAEGL